MLQVVLGENSLLFWNLNHAEVWFYGLTGKSTWKCVGGKPGMCEHTFPLYSTAVVTIFRFVHACITFTFIAEKNQV